MIFDGAFGTELEKRGIMSKMPELLNITHPDQIAEIHKSYIDAGCDFITTNTFGANRIKMPEEDRRAVIEGAIALAKRHRTSQYVMMDIGPLGKMLAPLGELPFDEAYEAFKEMVLAARDLGLLWVAIEATTLFSAPLIIYYRTSGAVEAMWKYLLICSVGIGFALFGTLLIACSVPDDNSPGLALDCLGQLSLDPLLFKTGFVFILAGYGTKADLAPFHNWIPDTYSEAHGPGSALISGTLLNASFLAIVKILDIAPEAARSFCNNLLMALGFLSIAVAAFFVIRQYDCKRMLGYSSIEHMGIAILLLVSGLPNFAICHLLCHAFFKSGLFMTTENIRLSYGSLWGLFLIE